MTAPTNGPPASPFVGGGVIGCELATIFSRFGTEVHLLDAGRRPPSLISHPRSATIVDDVAAGPTGVRVRRGVDDRPASNLVGSGCAFGQRSRRAPASTPTVLLIATGTRPRTTGLGARAPSAIDPAEPMTGSDSMVGARGNVIAVGDRRCRRLRRVHPPGQPSGARRRRTH